MVDFLTVINPVQAARLFFRYEFGLKKAQARLKVLTDRKYLSRVRTETGYVYYRMGRKPGQLGHRLGTVYGYIYLCENFGKWGGIQRQEREYVLGEVRADLFVIMKRLTEYEGYFLEYDNSENNVFDKIRKYNELYEKGDYTKESWVNLVKRFPGIVLVVNSKNREKQVMDKIGKENRNKLRFQVVKLESITG